MKCPNCGTIEQSRIRVCPKCNTAYASEDLLKLRQLEYLLAETESWPKVDEQRKVYAEHLAALKKRIFPMSSSPATTITPEIAIPIIATKQARMMETPAPAQPKPEPVPFDQWLLSERNIKIALYSGGALLILAGLIFVSVNWARIPGLAKFAVTLTVTGLMYLGGYLLFRRPTLRLGGVALLAVSCGFIPLNFVVLHAYIFGPQGMSTELMWLIGSLITMSLYILTAAWTRIQFFTYMSLGGLVSVFTALLALQNVETLVYTLVYSILALIILAGAIMIKSTRSADVAYTPMLLVSQITIPLLFLASAGQWLVEMDCKNCPFETPWLALISMGIGVIFYIITDFSFRWLFARWISTFGFAITFMFTLKQLQLSNTTIGIILMILALIILFVGKLLEQRGIKRSGVWPLYTASYAVAAFVTLQTLIDFNEDPADLALTLTADAILLAISAWIHRQYKWIYGVAWLLIVPVYIYASIYIKEISYLGLVLGALMLIYSAAGYELGRRNLKLCWPFFTAAAFLSVVVVAFTWIDSFIATIALITIAVLYLLAALWRKQSWLLIPALIAANLGIVTTAEIFLTSKSPWIEILTISYASLGILLALGGALLRQAGKNIWGWPLYLMAAIDISGSYISGVLLGGAIAISLSATFALLFFGLAWFESKFFKKLKLPPILSYLGAVLIFGGQFYVIELSSRSWHQWPIYVTGLCALMIVVSWLLRKEPVSDLYGIPLRRIGEWLVLIPLAGSIVINEPLLIAITFTIAGVTFAADARIRHIIRIYYIAGAAFIVVIWTILNNIHIKELQAYIIPLGFSLLAIGRNERRLGGKISYRLPTLLGLLILMGSLFYQSLSDVVYAVFLLLESLVIIAWGARIHSRSFVELGLFSLIVNGIAQLGPGFMQLSRWIQLAIVGSILLGGGLTALFRRDQLLNTRKRLIAEWRQWDI